MTPISAFPGAIIKQLHKLLSKAWGASGVGEALGGLKQACPKPLPPPEVPYYPLPAPQDPHNLLWPL